MVKKTNTLKIDELNLSSTTLRVLERRDLLGSVVWAGRELAIKSDCHQINLEKGSKWQKEIVSALDQAGFIRHNYLRTYRVWRFYRAVVAELEDFLSEKIYENTPDISDEAFASFMEALNSLTEKEKLVIVNRFGLIDGIPKTQDELGKRFFLTVERIRQIEARALRKMRQPERLRMLPELFGFVPPEEEKPLCDVPDEEEKALGLDAGIEKLDLSVRAYNCLKKAGINTVGDLVRLSPEEAMRIRNLGRRALEEVFAKVRSIGYYFNHQE